MTIAGESDRETNEATRQFSFYPVTTGLSTDCDKFIIFTYIKLSVQPYIWRIWKTCIKYNYCCCYKKKNTKVNNEYLYTIPWFIHNCIHRSF